MHALPYIQMGFKIDMENGGEITCSVYFPLFQVVGLE
jgi:hypothetical protein